MDCYLESIISIHALLAESDLGAWKSCNVRRNFYPRSPCGERPIRICQIIPIIHFYPRSPCGERPSGAVSCSICSSISIHALLAESDYSICNELRKNPKTFLSTLSLRRATLQGQKPSGVPCKISIHALLAESDSQLEPPIQTHRYFYPRSPCGERPNQSEHCER